MCIYVYVLCVFMYIYVFWTIIIYVSDIAPYLHWCEKKIRGCVIYLLIHFAFLYKYLLNNKLLFFSKILFVIKAGRGFF